MSRDEAEAIGDYDDDYERYRLTRDPWLGLVDERGYAAFRIAFSIVAFANLVNLWAYRESFFSSAGMISADAIADLGWHTRLSLFMYFDSIWMVVICFFVAAAAIICLGLGVSPRAAAVVVFIWHLSFTYRAGPGTSGWDFALRAYSFLIMVSPLGRCWCLGAKAIVPKLVPNYGITLMRIQVLVIYWQTVVLKLGDKYWQDGEFLTYFLMSNFARWPHERVAAWHDLLIPMTYGALMIEIAIPILLFIPRTRRVGAVIGISFHLLIAITGRHLFLFSATMCMTYVAFITPGALDRIDARWRKH